MPGAPYHAPMPKDRRLVRVCRELIADPADQRDLDELARVAGMSRRTFTRLFRAETGAGLCRVAATDPAHGGIVDADLRQADHQRRV